MVEKKDKKTAEKPSRTKTDATATPANGKLLKDLAYEAIKERILSEEFSPGDFLSERVIAKWLNMSKTPIKTALERLEIEGFISISPRQGAVVRDLTLQDICNVFEIRSILETYAVRHLAGRLTQDQVLILQENLKEQKACMERMDVSQSIILDGEYHLLLCRFLNNSEINNVMNLMKDKIYRLIHRVLTQYPDRLKANDREHTAILEAIKKGSGDQAAQLVQDHLEWGKMFLMSPRSRLNPHTK